MNGQRLDPTKPAAWVLLTQAAGLFTLRVMLGAASVLDRAGSAIAQNRGMIAGAAGAIRDPRSIGLGVRSTVTPNWRTRPFDSATYAPAPGGPGGLIMSGLRPAVDLYLGNEVVSIEPWGDPDELVVGPILAGVMAVGVGLAAYGAYRLVKDFLF